MPTISGYVRDAKVTTATNAKGKTVDVSKKTAEELVKEAGKREAFHKPGRLSLRKQRCRNRVGRFRRISLT